jgi:NodT family efflux transporter outer membrane factor (OMF) lipoprotein
VSLIIAITISACATVPQQYQAIPEIKVPAQFSGYANWLPVGEQHLLSMHNQWWLVYQDKTLTQLIEHVTVDNESLKASEAQYRAALATLEGSQSARYPSISSTANASNGTVASSNSFSNNSLPTNSNYALSVSTSWELDLWGRIRQTVESNEAKGQASLADLYAARLSTQVLLAQTYFQLRNTEQQIRLVNSSITAYQRFVKLTQIRQRAGVVSRLDVAQASAQLYTTQVQQLDLEEQYSRYQHTIATLLGVGATAFNIPASSQDNEKSILPIVSQIIPSTLLLNRPDIIASERRVASANAQIGIAQTAFFPTINLIGSVGYRNSNLTDLINIPNSIWSLGPSLAFTLFDSRLRESTVAVAIAGMEQATANYKQTVLSAFQEVEDSLSSVRLLQEEAAVQQQALDASMQAYRIAQSQYRAGTSSALNVISAQTAELSAQRNQTNITLRQQLASLILLKNSGGSLPIALKD